jgi:hypothetical protein
VRDKAGVSFSEERGEKLGSFLDILRPIGMNTQRRNAQIVSVVHALGKFRSAQLYEILTHGFIHGAIELEFNHVFQARA